MWNKAAEQVNEQGHTDMAEGAKYLKKLSLHHIRKENFQYKH
jgi:hypothetical protein